VFYRPGDGACYILKNAGGTFVPVYGQGGGGTGLAVMTSLGDNRDLGFAFDYDGSGKLDPLVFYRPGDGTCWVLRNMALSELPELCKDR
jgi:hypothetical protein